MNDQAQPDPEPARGGPPPPPSFTLTSSDSNAPEPTPHRLVYRTARRIGLTEPEARGIVRKVGLRIAKMIAAGKMKDRRTFSRQWLLQITRWSVADFLRKKGGNKKGRSRPRDS